MQSNHVGRRWKKPLRYKFPTSAMRLNFERQGATVNQYFPATRRVSRDPVCQETV
jgi:hypothetical protein